MASAKKDNKKILVKPVEIKVGKIGRDGKIDLNFNQKMKIPNLSGTSGSRRLGALDELDVQRDILELQFV